jgi:hypothetical protein
MDCIFDPPNLLEDLLWCNIHVSAQGWGQELMDVDVKVKSQNQQSHILINRHHRIQYI